MSSKVTGSILDVSLFKRLMKYIRPYRFTFVFVLTAAILLSVFSTLNPYLLKITVDDYITLKDYDGMLVFIGIMTGVLFLEVFSSFRLFIMQIGLDNELFMTSVMNCLKE